MYGGLRKLYSQQGREYGKPEQGNNVQGHSSFSNLLIQVINGTPRAVSDHNLLNRTSNISTIAEDGTIIQLSQQICNTAITLEQWGRE